jgi:hypothetical protein
MIYDVNDPRAYDEHGCVRDGVTIRVPKMLRDHVLGDAPTGRFGIIHTGGFHKPGFVMLADASARDAAEEARQQMIADARNAWKGQREDDDNEFDKTRPMLDAAEAERLVTDARNTWIAEMQNAWKR